MISPSNDKYFLLQIPEKKGKYLSSKFHTNRLLFQRIFIIKENFKTSATIILDIFNTIFPYNLSIIHCYNSQIIVHEKKKKKTIFHFI